MNISWQAILIIAAAARVDMPLIGTVPASVDGEHDCLRAELEAQLGDQLGPANGSGVDADLVGPGQQQAAHVLYRADAPAHRQRHEHLVGHRGRL